jgi:hypothetical protein
LEERWKSYEDEEEDVGGYWIILSKREDTGILRGSTRSHFPESWLWKRLRACRKTDY